MSKPIVYCCPPVQRKDQEELGLTLVIPGPDYITGNCDVCGKEVWIGPRQQKSMKEQPGALHCFKCGVSGGARSHNIQHLGGEGATYIRKEYNE
jgi:hypothetical protein